MVRNQLEQCDWLQGFNLAFDSNSGHGQLLSVLVQELIKDEIPKAPISLFAIKNEYYREFNEEMRQRTDLLDLNRSLWLSELTPLSDIIVPLDCVQLGSQVSPFLKRYQPGLPFHQSSL